MPTAGSRNLVKHLNQDEEQSKCFSTSIFRSFLVPFLFFVFFTTGFNSLPCIKQQLDEVFVISGMVEVELKLSVCPQLITLTKA